ncbi:type III-B CRISPR module-associated protein Cmr5 [Fervidobacterium islandicum]|uniref:type III-B CRISPR module-associated protein Cmr5 n=1 Tax=Fervidobacterium islandicum TaxID=2423 RepID=UPI003A5D8D8E
MTEVVKKAVECVQEMVNKEQNEKEKYLNTVKGLGSMIIQNGLYGTILFLMVKKQDKIIEHIDKLIEVQTGVKNFSALVKEGEVQRNTEYFKRQYAALEGVKWLRRYADIYLG